MGLALEIRTDLARPAQPRASARRERSPRTATRILAIACALEGMSRAEAARLAGMERQALRDAVVRAGAVLRRGHFPFWARVVLILLALLGMVLTLLSGMGRL